MFGLANGLSGGVGGANPWAMLSQAGQGLQTRGQPRMMHPGMAAARSGFTGLPQPGGGMMPQAQPFSMPGGGGMDMSQLLPLLMRGQGGGGGVDLQSLLGGPASPASWQAGTRTIPGGTPEHWLYNLFNRGQ